MSQFNLKVAFTQEQLEIMYAAGINVIIGKLSDGGPPNVAWQVFKPLKENTLSWIEEYGIYASTTNIYNGAIINPLSSTPSGAMIGKQYVLENSGIISGPHGGGYPNAFLLLNQLGSMPYMTAGLYQNASINGSERTGNVVSAIPLLSYSMAAMTPSTTLYIWLQSNVVSNSITKATSLMTELKFGSTVNEISIKYDSATGKFVPSKNSTLKSSSEPLNYIEPSL